MSGKRYPDEFKIEAVKQVTDRATPDGVLRYSSNSSIPTARDCLGNPGRFKYYKGTMNINNSFADLKIGLIIISLAISFSASAEERKPQRLLSSFEWGQLCNKAIGSESDCKSRIFLSTIKGRSLGTYELITPNDPSLLLSRSGVILGNNLNSHVLEVREDRGLKTVLKLTNDVTCQAYSASPDLVGVPDARTNYGRLINSWLAVYSDDPSQVRNISIGRNSSLSSLQFEGVMTEKNRGIRGIYWLDAQAHASIFSTCDFPLEVAQAEDTAEIFFDSIIGSARRYLRD